MIKPRMGVLECAFFAFGLLAITYVADKSETKVKPSHDQEFVLDNGQKCKMDKNSAVLCTDSTGAYQPVAISFAPTRTAQK